MTEKQKYLEACNFAIMQLTKKGSCSVVMNIGTEDQFVVDWKDVGKWLNKEYEQESRKGHWISTYGNVKCSVCGSVKDSRDVGKATHYCDFCGAKMESEVGE